MAVIVHPPLRENKSGARIDDADYHREIRLQRLGERGRDSVLMDAHASFSVAVLAQDGRDDLRAAGAQEGSRPPCWISCNLSKRNEAPLSLGIICTIGPLRLIGFPNRFRTDNPGIERSMMEATPGRLSEMLMEGKRDSAVMAQPDSFDGRLVAQRLYPERFVVAFRPVTALNRGNGPARRGRSRSGSPTAANARTGSRPTAGLGIGFLPESCRSLPGLQRRLLVDPEVVRAVSLVTVAGRRYSPVVAAFIRAIRSHRWPQDAEAVLPARNVGRPAELERAAPPR